LREKNFQKYQFNTGRIVINTLYLDNDE